MEAALSQTLDDLEAHGVLQKGNRIDLAGLVDILEEQVPEDATEEEIYNETVQQMRCNKEDMEINGGDDGYADVAQAPKPACKGALKAVSVLCGLLMHEEGDFARKLELGLATFGRETRLDVMHAFTAALAFALGTFVHEEVALACAGSLGALVVRAMSCNCSPGSSGWPPKGLQWTLAPWTSRALSSAVTVYEPLSTGTSNEAHPGIQIYGQTTITWLSNLLIGLPRREEARRCEQTASHAPWMESSYIGTYHRQHTSPLMRTGCWAASG
ncbi:hypothetical protein C8J57DRAFT_1705917 [Mycena rebaudengoi]|nr:hypothetical protein C8J57DRAFT_1705917 [Mycena rebaudengoi]